MQVSNILIITDTGLNTVGGSEKHIRFIVENLDGDRFHFFVAELTGLADDYTYALPRFEKLSPAVKFIPFHIGAIYRPPYFLAYWRLLRLIAHHNIQVIISFHEKSDILNALLFSWGGKPPVKISSRRDMNICPSRVLLRLRHQLARCYDHVVAPTRAVLELTHQVDHIPWEKMEVVPNSIDTSRFAPNPTPSARKPDGMRFVYTANLREVKGHGYLIKAFAKVLERFPASTLTLIGNDLGSRDKLEQMIAQLGLEHQIILTGPRADVETLLREADCMVCSSLSEGLSNALLEGLACGLPIIATRVGGNPDTVIDEENGYLVEPADTGDLTEKMLKICGMDDENLARMGRCSRQLAVSRFSLPHIINQYERYFAPKNEAWRNRFL